jgi:hypothetical protein
MAVNPEDDSKRLKKEIANLQRKLAIAEEINAILREFPAHPRAPRLPKEKSAATGPRKASRTKLDEKGEKDGEETGSISEPGTPRSGMRKPSVPCRPEPNPGPPDGAGEDPSL